MQVPLELRHNYLFQGEQTHKIPIEGMAEEGDTYAKIYQDLCEFVMVGKRVVPPLFCKVCTIYKMCYSIMVKTGILKLNTYHSFNIRRNIAGIAKICNF